jgi:hypothetical protein
MLDHLAVQRACRTRLGTMLVCTTGATSLSVTATGYARTAGSFVTDGFEVGLEVRGAGFANAINNGVGVITRVDPLALRVSLVVATYASGVRTVTRPATVAEGAAGGRTLSVGLPSFAAWENVGFVPETGIPYWDEQYVRGPASLNTIGPNGRITGEPMYLPRINVQSDTSVEAPSRYAAAMINAFPPGDKIVLPNGDVLEIRGDAAPYSGQLLPNGAGFAGLLSTVPLRVRSWNSQ